MFGRFLRRLLPSSKKQVTDRFDELNKNLEIKIASLDSKLTGLYSELANVDSRLADLDAKITSLDSKMAGIDSKLTSLSAEMTGLDSKIASFDSKLTNRIANMETKTQKTLNETLGFARENNWGIIFNDTIEDSEWLTETNFSLGRWAIGYQCAYVLFRVLNEVKPKKILELGLGQSTKLISQYVEKNVDVEHKVFESNPEWIDFFKLNYNIPENTQIVQSDWVFMDYDGVEHVRAFDGFDEKIKNQKFDLIMIDAPLGGDMPDLARIDVLRNLPECLEKSFVILIDDAERSGEKNTFEKMKEKLEGAEVSIEASLYWGKKCLGVIASEDLKFVCTM